MLLKMIPFEMKALLELESLMTSRTNRCMRKKQTMPLKFNVASIGIVHSMQYST